MGLVALMGHGSRQGAASKGPGQRLVPGLSPCVVTGKSRVDLARGAGGASGDAGAGSGALSSPRLRCWLVSGLCCGADVCAWRTVSPQVSHAGVTQSVSCSGDTGSVTRCWVCAGIGSMRADTGKGSGGFSRQWWGPVPGELIDFIGV